MVERIEKSVIDKIGALKLLEVKTTNEDEVVRHWEIVESKVKTILKVEDLKTLGNVSQLLIEYFATTQHKESYV